MNQKYINNNLVGIRSRTIVKEDEIVNTINEGEKAIIVLNETSFYAEGGGQAGDIGTLENEDAIFEVVDTKKGANNTIKHIGFVKKGQIKVSDALESKVNKEVRMASARNHTATHLLHEALKEVANGDANKVFIPFEATSALGSLGAIKEVMKDEKKKKIIHKI